MKSQLGLVVDVNLEGLVLAKRPPTLIQTHTLHEFLAGSSDLLGKSGREHHDLLVVGGRAEDFLDVASHVCSGKGQRKEEKR